MSPRHVAHFLVLGVVTLVALFAGPKRTEVANSALGWTFEPFSASARSAEQAGWLRARAESAVDEPVNSLPQPSLVAPPGPRSKIVTYVVQPGDTLSGIARAYGVKPETVLWTNNLADADFIALGDRLRIPPGNGVMHMIRPGETMAGIAARYNLEASAILGHPFNQIGDGSPIAIGREIFVPGGVQLRVAAAPAPAAPVATPAPRPAPPPAAIDAPASAARPAPSAVQVPVPAAVPPPAGAKLGWPAAGNLTQGYSAAHRGIDIIAPYGNPVFASGDGVVITAANGWNGGFGNMVEVDHGGGIVSRYAHLSVTNVSAGQRVGRGQVVGQIGTSGIATAPHVHFEVLNGGYRSDPMAYLR